MTLPRPRILDGRAIPIVLALTVGGLVSGIVLSLAGRSDAAAVAWSVPTIVVAIRLAWSILRDLVARRAGVDVIALLAVSGALALDELFAAAVIGLMLATGEALEAYAEGQARRELAALLGRAPRDVHRYGPAGLELVLIDAVVPGDVILVRPGEVVPVDGVIRDDAATLDELALTGESRLVARVGGDTISSGVVNAGGAFDLRAIATADASTYAGIVRLVDEAGRAKAPFVRLADRYAVLFVPLALGLAAAAALAAGDLSRGLAVLVVATPCPLLLAAPIAIVAGISRAARRGIIVKGGGPLEQLARSRVLLFDKTGTLTAGRPTLASIVCDSVAEDDLLTSAAALEQASPHVLAGAIIRSAHDRGLTLPAPTDVTEQAGAGIEGLVDGVRVRVGSAAFAGGSAPLPSWARELGRRAALEGATNVYVAVDGRLAGGLVLVDPIRPETPRAVRSLRRAGFTRIVMVTGDHHALAELVGEAVGLDGVLAERSPSEKLGVVRLERELATAPLVMVGDGINDAPALAAADVGVAMGARGATASSEAADVVITVDRLDRLPEAVQIARRARSIALQSVVAGMLLSLGAMVLAALGFLPVVVGALVQEAIDVAVILNALRALAGGVERAPRVPGWAAIRERLDGEHRGLASGIAGLRTTADALESLDASAAHDGLAANREFLVSVLAAHERTEDQEIYAKIAAAAGSDDATASLHRTHSEILHLVRVFDALIDEIGPDGPTEDDRIDARRILYGLHAILRLHMAQEDDLYLSIEDDRAPAMA